MTITASAKLDATKTTSCVITIDEFGMTLQGVVYDSDNNGVTSPISMADDRQLQQTGLEASENFTL